MLSRMTRRQIIELLETVREGIVCPNMKERAAMLGECIAALDVSRNICGKELSKDCFAQYKDTMDTLTAALGQVKESPAEEITALSLQLLEWLLGELKKEKVKKEIVFLPYKASMWDSLESIWRAAAEDSEHCNAYVVPIPYADFTKEHTVKEWHCEIDLFPKDVPVLDYSTVDLEKMHPDVIFIHNPYDYANYITSVDSRYYSAELKKYTDKLVYVPYFVIGNNLAPHFAQAPGVVNADYVIVESEEIKEQYERYYPGGNSPEGKFLALGSPKFDKVLGAKREDYELPEKWKKLLNGRKAILYNTGVTAVLQNRETYLKKVRSVFETFKQRDDVVLWWRPHPLLEATFDSMVPEQAEEYRELRDEYIQAGWGIYDDSPELERAITWTDAYYGDQSSIVWMYQATGKSVIYQEIDYTAAMEPFDIPVWTQSLCSDGKWLWFVEGKVNLLMRYQLESDQLVCEAVIPTEQFMQEYAYNTIRYAAGKIFLIPSWARHIFVYDIKKKSFCKLEFPRENAYFGVAKFQDAFVYEDWVYCIPSHYDFFLRINIKTLILEIVEDVRELYHSAGVPGDSVISAADWYGDDSVVALIYQTHKLIRWNLKQNSFDILDVSEVDRGFGSVAVTENKVFLAGRSDKNYVEIFDRQTGCLEGSIQQDFCGVKRMSNRNVVIWNPDTGHWCAINGDSYSVLHEGGKTQRMNGALQFTYHSFIVCAEERMSYGVSCHDNTFFVFNQDGTVRRKIKLSLRSAENLPSEEEWMKNNTFYEFPGMNINVLFAVSNRTLMQDKCSVGGLVYDELCK